MAATQAGGGVEGGRDPARGRRCEQSYRVAGRQRAGLGRPAAAGRRGPGRQLRGVARHRGRIPLPARPGRRPHRLCRRRRRQYGGRRRRILPRRTAAATHEPKRRSRDSRPSSRRSERAWQSHRRAGTPTVGPRVSRAAWTRWPASGEVGTIIVDRIVLSARTATSHELLEPGPRRRRALALGDTRARSTVPQESRWWSCCESISTRTATTAVEIERLRLRDSLPRNGIAVYPDDGAGLPRAGPRGPALPRRGRHERP